MAAPCEKHHYIASEELRKKYLGHFDQVRSLTKAIGDSSRTKITVELKKNNTIQFVITGGRKGVEKALQGVRYEFEERQSKPKAQPRNQPKTQPINQPRARQSSQSVAELKHRADLLFLEEDDHQKLQREGNLCLLTENSLRKHDILTGATELRQFACEECNRPWWKYVPRTKPVSTCRTCHVRYDALDRGEEFGIGRFICRPCENTFYARCDATEMHLCFKCQTLRGPPYINPRFKPVFNSDKLYRTYKEPIFRREIMHASMPHDSTGSTVSSFLTVDLGPDIPVLVERGYGISARDYGSSSGPSSSSSPTSSRSPSPSPSPVMPSVGIVGDVSELEPHQDAKGGGHGSEFEGSEISDLEAESPSNSTGNVSRKRTTGSDSSDSEEASEVDKMSTHGLEPDSDTIVENHLEEGSQKQTDSSDSDDGSSQRVETEPTGNSVVVLAPCDSSTGTTVVNHLDGDTKDNWPDLMYHREV